MARGARLSVLNVLTFAGATIFVQNDPTQTFYILKEGGIKISQLTPADDQIVVRYLGDGDMVGCIVLSGMTVYPATGNAVGPCTLIRCSRKPMGDLVECHPELATNTLTTVAMRMRELQERLGELANDRVERRIARTMLRLVVQAGERADDGTRIDFPISRQDIADMTGTTLHTVSRTLSGWEGHGLVKLGLRKVTVTDVDGIAYIGGRIQEAA
ncbi:MAG: Crp/Fnr family transcriptional regulator [Rhodospirillaceae bacterium]|nr:Crp/Fnr family transcriptional regulator [Rhodospirillaceae bacterium]|tara:strand:+ start:2165 stop:2806 length:642 start_codon:yes stop_codon:yes gene_type:complete